MAGIMLRFDYIPFHGRELHLRQQPGIQTHFVRPISSSKCPGGQRDWPYLAYSKGTGKLGAERKRTHGQILHSIIDFSPSTTLYVYTSGCVYVCAYSYIYVCMCKCIYGWVCQCVGVSTSVYVHK